jgi:hypothetical protein
LPLQKSDVFTLERCKTSYDIILQIRLMLWPKNVRKIILLVFEKNCFNEREWWSSNILNIPN